MRAFLNKSLSWAVAIAGKVVFDEYRFARELADRNQKRPGDGLCWFTSEEMRTIGKLAEIIVPSDELGPGATEAGTGKSIDRCVSRTSATRQATYVTGLYGFDEIAHRKYGSVFGELTHEKQLNLFKLVDGTYQQMRLDNASLRDKLYRKIGFLRCECDQRGLGAAVSLFPWLVRDVLQLFYTSKTAWDWLGYEGPAIARGYAGDIHQYSAPVRAEAQGQARQ